MSAPPPRSSRIPGRAGRGRALRGLAGDPGGVLPGGRGGRAGPGCGPGRLGGGPGGRSRCQTATRGAGPRRGGDAGEGTLGSWRTYASPLPSGFGEAEAGRDLGEAGRPGPGRGGRSGASWRGRGSRAHFWKGMRRPGRGGEMARQELVPRLKVFRVPGSNPWGMGLRLCWDPDPVLGGLQASSAMPPGAQSGGL